MFPEKAHALGGYSRARKIQEDYNKNPHLCKQCGSPIIFDGTQKLGDVKKKIFCSRSCSATYNNAHKNKYSVMHKNYKNSNVSKLSDNTIIEAFNSSMSRLEFFKKLNLTTSTITRSLALRMQILNLDISDLDNKKVDMSNKTKGEIRRTTSNYQSFRSAIRKHANQIFWNSNNEKECMVCGYKKHIEVAHKKAVSSFSDDEKLNVINDISNLIGLCPNHHWEYDHNMLDLSHFK